MSLKVASILSEPFLMQDASGSFSGYIKDLLDALTEVTGNEHQIVLTEDQRYGSFNQSTNQWTGMVGMVQRKEAEFIAADLTQSAKRSEILDFTTPFLTNPLTILTKVPSSCLTFLSPFSWDFWLLLFVLFMTASLVLWLVARISPQENNKDQIRDFAGAAWFLFAAFFRGADFSPRACSTRIVSAGWWIFAFLVLVSYAGNLHNSDGYGYGSVDELVKDSDFMFGVFKGGSTYQMLKNSVSELHKEIYQKIADNEEQSLLSNYTDGLAKVEGGNYGIIMEASIADFKAGKDCTLQTIGHLDERYYPLAFGKESPNRDIYTAAIMRLQESGKLRQLHDEWLSSEDECYGSFSGRINQHNLYTMMEPVIFLGVLLIVGFVISFLELVIAAKKSRSGAPHREIKVGNALKEAFCGCFSKGNKNNGQTLPLSGSEQD